jgi:hypothetical protein
MEYNKEGDCYVIDTDDANEISTVIEVETKVNWRKAASISVNKI